MEMGEKLIHEFRLVLFSFGFKHGVPIDANMVFDARFLPNPYWQEALRPLSGCDDAVAGYVVNSVQGEEFLRLLKPLLSFLVEQMAAGNKKELRVAVGCTGGRHRSVAVVEALQHFLQKNATIEVATYHRDISRDE